MQLKNKRCITCSVFLSHIAVIRSHGDEKRHTKQMLSMETSGAFSAMSWKQTSMGKGIRVSHDFDNVIIDEVDSMLVDKGETVLYLPHEIPNLSSLENVYLEIWSLVNTEQIQIEFFINDVQQLEDLLYEAVKCKLFGGLSVKAFTAIPGVSEDLSESIHLRCRKIGLIDKEYYVPATTDMNEIGSEIKSFSFIKPEMQQEVALIIQEHMSLRLPIHPSAFNSVNKRQSDNDIHSTLVAAGLIDKHNHLPTTTNIEEIRSKIPTDLSEDSETILPIFCNHLVLRRVPIDSVPKELHWFVKKNLRVLDQISHCCQVF